MEMDEESVPLYQESSPQADGYSLPEEGDDKTFPESSAAFLSDDARWLEFIRILYGDEKLPP